jgi:hypothetical protein
MYERVRRTTALAATARLAEHNDVVGREFARLRRRDTGWLVLTDAPLAEGALMPRNNCSL